MMDQNKYVKAILAAFPKAFIVSKDQVAVVPCAESRLDSILFTVSDESVRVDIYQLFPSACRISECDEQKVLALINQENRDATHCAFYMDRTFPWIHSRYQFPSCHEQTLFPAVLRETLFFLEREIVCMSAKIRFILGEEDISVSVLGADMIRETQCRYVSYTGRANPLEEKGKKLLEGLDSFLINKKFYTLKSETAIFAQMGPHCARFELVTDDFSLYPAIRMMLFLKREPVFKEDLKTLRLIDCLNRENSLLTYYITEEQRIECSYTVRVLSITNLEEAAYNFFFYAVYLKEKTRECFEGGKDIDIRDCEEGAKNLRAIHDQMLELEASAYDISTVVDQLSASLEETNIEEVLEDELDEDEYFDE